MEGRLRRVWECGLTLPCSSMRKESPKLSSPTMSVARNVHHLWMSALPCDCTSPWILATASSILLRIEGSTFLRKPYVKVCAKSFRRSEWTFGSVTENKPGSDSPVSFMYQLDFRHPPWILCISLKDAGSEMETSNGAIRTIRPYFWCRESI